MPSEPREVSLSEFSDAERRRINRFVSQWVKNHKRNPEAWPLTLPQGHWDEQFMIFEGDDDE